MKKRISLENNSYLVEPSERPKEAIKLAIKKGLFKKFNLENKLIDNYFNNKCCIPIRIIEAVCKFNEDYPEVPIIYQNLWFCLNKVRIKRVQPNGRIIETKVKFSPMYLNDKKIYSLITGVVNIYGKNYFSYLNSVSRSAVGTWINNKVRIPFSAVIKACELLKKDVWNEIDKLKIYTRTNDHTIFFNNRFSPELRDIIVWIKEEGHLSLSGQIQIEQKDRELLENIRSLFIKVFSLPKKQTHITDKGKGNFCLHIYSHAIRQILCLKFNIPIGYKSKISTYSMFKKLENKEDKSRIVAKLIETEGSLTYCNKKYDFLQPKFYFGVSNKETINFYNKLLVDLEYKFYTNSRRRKTGISYESSICNLSDAAKLCYEVFPYFNHKKKIKDATNVLSQDTYLKRLRIKNNDKLRNLIRKAYSTGDPKNKEHVLKLARKLSKIGKKYNYKIHKYNIFDWLRRDNDIRKTNIPLLAVLLLCNVTNENYFKYVPKELSFLLFLHKFISFDGLKKLRGEVHNHYLNVNKQWIN